MNIENPKNTTAALCTPRVSQSPFQQSLFSDRPSPLVQSIRRQFLPSTQDETILTRRSKDRASPQLSERRLRLEKKKHKLGSIGLSPRQICTTTRLTPTTAAPSCWDGENFKTPSPISNATGHAVMWKESHSNRHAAPSGPRSLPLKPKEERQCQTEWKDAPATVGKPMIPRNHVDTRRSPLQRMTVNTRTPASSHETDIGTRRNMDKRTARLRYSKEFSAHIASSIAVNHSPCLITPRFHQERATDSSVQIFVRKRPIFDHEVQRGDFDVVSVNAQSSMLTVHRTFMAADMKTKHVEPIVYENFTAVFDSNVDSKSVYEQAVAPLAEKVLLGHCRTATLLMFGQTGSGKTHTMTNCQVFLAADIFARSTIKSVSVECVELAGKICRDLGVNGCPVVKVQDFPDGSVHFRNARSVLVTCPEELVNHLLDAMNRRSTESTLHNDVSSRSHAMYQIRLESTDNSEGIINLVDCAGTERRNDSLYHSKDRQTESSEINSSLYALKECIRARQNGSKHIPYRSSLLTRVLRECLEDDTNLLTVVATVAPNATDTEHTLETLKTVCMWINHPRADGSLSSSKATIVNTIKPTVDSPTPQNPKQWTHMELVEWMARKRLLQTADSAVPSHVDGRAVMRMSELQLRAIFYSKDVNLERSIHLFRCLRAEASRADRLDLKRRFAMKADHMA